MVRHKVYKNIKLNLSDETTLLIKCEVQGAKLRKLGVRAWRRKALDMDDWKKVLAAARAQTGL